MSRDSGRPNPLDPLDLLRSARETSARMQELIIKATLPAEQRKALVEGVSKLVLPGEQLQAMIDLAEAFGPPQTQIAEIQKTLTAQREHLESMHAELERVEAGLERLAAATEQIALLQTPLRKLLTSMQSRDADEPEE